MAWGGGVHRWRVCHIYFYFYLYISISGVMRVHSCDTRQHWRHIFPEMRCLPCRPLEMGQTPVCCSNLFYDTPLILRGCRGLCRKGDPSEAACPQTCSQHWYVRFQCRYALPQAMEGLAEAEDAMEYMAALQSVRSVLPLAALCLSRG